MQHLPTFGKSNRLNPIIWFIKLVKNVRDNLLAVNMRLEVLTVVLLIYLLINGIVSLWLWCLWNTDGRVSVMTFKMFVQLQTTALFMVTPLT